MIVLLSSCIYERQNIVPSKDEISSNDGISLEDGIYKILIDNELISKYTCKKKIEADRFVSGLKDINDNLDQEIRDEIGNEIGEDKLEEFKLELKKNILLLSDRLKKEVLNETNKYLKEKIFLDDIYKVKNATKDLIKNAIKKSYNESNRAKILEKILLSKFSPILFFVDNIEYINSSNYRLNIDNIYDNITKGDLSNLRIEMLRNKREFISELEKIYIHSKCGKVFICYKDLSTQIADKLLSNDEVPLLQFYNLISLNIRTTKSKVYLEGIEIKLLKIK